jgi:hypothetical protein
MQKLKQEVLKAFLENDFEGTNIEPAPLFKKLFTL